MPRTNFQDLLDAGVHFGHMKRKWNPKMAPYIFMEKNGIHIIDLHRGCKYFETIGFGWPQSPLRSNEKTG